nr:lysozyme [Delftia sp. SD018]
MLATLGVEGFRPDPHIPTQGDRPTIGHGSTVYEDGTPVQLSDPPISRERALQLVRSHTSKDEAMFRDSLPGVALYQAEYDLYLDFTYQYGIGAWRTSPMRTRLLAGQFAPACQALLGYRFMTSPKREGAGWEPYQWDAAGRPKRWRYDCSTPGNRICRGVWTRQQARHAACMEAQ